MDNVKFERLKYIANLMHRYNSITKLLDAISIDNIESIDIVIKSRFDTYTHNVHNDPTIKNSLINMIEHIKAQITHECNDIVI